MARAGTAPRDAKIPGSGHLADREQATKRNGGQPKGGSRLWQSAIAVDAVDGASCQRLGRRRGRWIGDAPKVVAGSWTSSAVTEVTALAASNVNTTADRYGGGAMRARLCATTLSAVLLVGGAVMPAHAAELRPGVAAVPTAATKTFTSEKYRFSFNYREPFRLRRGTTFAGEGGSGAESTAGVFDVTGNRIAGQYRDAFVVNVYELNQAITPGLLPAVRRELRVVIRQLKANTPSMSTTRLKRTAVNGIPGFRLLARFRVSEVPMRTRMTFLFNDDTEYQLLEQTTKQDWSALQGRLTTMRNSFAAY